MIEPELLLPNFVLILDTALLPIILLISIWEETTVLLLLLEVFKYLLLIFLIATDDDGTTVLMVTVFVDDKDEVDEVDIDEWWTKFLAYIFAITSVEDAFDGRFTEEFWRV